MKSAIHAYSRFSILSVVIGLRQIVVAPSYFKQPQEPLDLGAEAIIQVDAALLKALASRPSIAMDHWSWASSVAARRSSMPLGWCTSSDSSSCQFSLHHKFAKACVSGKIDDLQRSLA